MLINMQSKELSTVLSNPSKFFFWSKLFGFIDRKSVYFWYLNITYIFKY